MIKYDFMRLIVFFDLPVKTKENMRQYRLFRKALIQKGFLMLQYSIYTRILNNREQGELMKTYVRKITPANGHVRMMLVTEKQYANIEIIIGGKSSQEEVLTVNPFIVL